MPPSLCRRAAAPRGGVVVALLLLFGGAASGCGGPDKPKTLPPGGEAELAYDRAYAQVQDGDCLDAEPKLQRIRRKYPFSRFAALAELRLADCLLDQDKPLEAIQAYRQFVRTRPSHPEIPYARFQIAYAHYKQVPTDWLLSPPAHERDQTPTREALRQLRRFLLDHPDDERAERARELAEETLRMLARHELYVAEYYLKRDAPEAAAARIRTMLRVYQGSGMEARALLLLGRTHLKARARDDARATFLELVERFPDTDEAVQAQSYLDELGLPSRPVDVGQN